MATVDFAQGPRLSQRAGRFVFLTGISLVHVLAFASVFFQSLWIVPVYAAKFQTAVRPIPAMTTNSIQFTSQLLGTTNQIAFLGVLFTDLVILTLLLQRTSSTNKTFTVYSHVILVGLIGFLVWNSIALCIGLPSL